MSDRAHLWPMGQRLPCSSLQMPSASLAHTCTIAITCLSCGYMKAWQYVDWLLRRFIRLCSNNLF